MHLAANGLHIIDHNYANGLGRFRKFEIALQPVLEAAPNLKMLNSSRPDEIKWAFLGHTFSFRFHWISLERHEPALLRACVVDDPENEVEVGRYWMDAHGNVWLNRDKDGPVYAIDEADLAFEVVESAARRAVEGIIEG